MSNETPDTCLIVLKSSGANPTASDYLWVDNLAFAGTISGISNDEINNSFSVYPNPATDEINLNFVVKESGNLNIEILDVTGRKVSEVMNETVTPGALSKSFSTVSLVDGNYFIRVNANGTISNYKLNVIH